MFYCINQGKRSTKQFSDSNDRGTRFLTEKREAPPELLVAEALGEADLVQPHSLQYLGTSQLKETIFKGSHDSKLAFTMFSAKWSPKAHTPHMTTLNC